MMSTIKLLIVSNLLILASSQTSLTNDTTFLCRSRGKMMTEKAFKYETCFMCYRFMPDNQFKKKWSQTLIANYSVDGYVIPWLTNGTHTVEADFRDKGSPIFGSFADKTAISRWTECCQAAENCCQKIKVSLDQLDNQLQVSDQGSVSDCPATWDGWQCWPDGGNPGEISYMPCPAYIFFQSSGGLSQDTCGRYAEKQCNASGFWHRAPNGLEWTDFMTCSRVGALLTQEYVHLSLYATSIIALLPAIIIFFSYKVLRVPRIAIHKNLFGSLLLHCISMITFKSVVLLPFIKSNGNEDTMLYESTVGCRFLMMLSKYFRLTNYTWMFCEGYYLHRLLANTFEEERSLKVILSIGWGLPLIPCIVYAILRVYGDDSLCFALPAKSHEWVEWIYMTPGLLCILANFVFFLNIFRILVTKLQAPHANEPAHFRKAVHATVVLLPLFGLHWLLTLYRPQSGAHCIWKTFYKYLNVILDGLQGLMVSIAFCYRNGEIRNLLKQTRMRLRDHFSSSPNTANHIPMKKLSRKNSETYVTQVGFSTTGSRLGSRYSLTSDSPSPHRGSNDHDRATTSLMTPPNFKNSGKTTLEVRKSHVSSSHSIDSL